LIFSQIGGRYTWFETLSILLLLKNPIVQIQPTLAFHLMELTKPDFNFSWGK